MLRSPALTLVLACAACRAPLRSFDRDLEGRPAGLEVTLVGAQDDVVLDLDLERDALARVSLSGFDRVRVSPRSIEAVAGGGTRVAFPRSVLDEAPWLLFVDRFGEPRIELPLARVEVDVAGPCEAVLGFREERWTLPDGRVRRYLVHGSGEHEERIAGERADVLAASFARLCSALPRTTEWLAGCPDVVERLVSRLESGAVYAGPAEGQNRHPHARGARFWSRARHVYGGADAGDEDPLDSLVWLLVEVANASAAEAYATIWNEVLAGRLSEEEYLAREAREKARSLRFAVDSVRRNARCLELRRWSHPYGVVFREYARWVDRSRGSDEALADLILAQGATYVDNPLEMGLTYGERLRRLWWTHSPLAARGGRS